MAHDVFISYSSKDKQAADAICHTLESNNLKCWIAPRNIRAGENYAQEIMDGLKAAKIVVLVFSKNSQESVFVTKEIDTAFSNNKPIISFKIDETLPEKKMGFFLKNKHWLDAYPNYEDLFDTLVKDAHRLCDDEYVPPTAHNFYGDKYDFNEDEEENQSTISKYKIPIIIAVAIVLIAVVGVVVFSGGGGADTNTTNSSQISIDYIGMDDDRSKGYSWKYSFFVFGSVPSQLSNSSKDVVHVEFYDDSGSVIQSNDTKLKDITGNVLGSAYLNKDNVAKVSVKLQDTNGKTISSAESTNIIKN